MLARVNAREKSARGTRSIVRRRGSGGISRSRRHPWTRWAPPLIRSNELVVVGSKSDSRLQPSAHHPPLPTNYLIAFVVFSYPHRHHSTPTSQSTTSYNVESAFSVRTYRMLTHTQQLPSWPWALLAYEACCVWIRMQSVLICNALTIITMWPKFEDLIMSVVSHRNPDYLSIFVSWQYAPCKRKQVNLEDLFRG